MTLKLIALAGLVHMLAECHGPVIVERERRPPPGPVVIENGSPGVVAASAPRYYEEGASLNGVVVSEPHDISDYVFIDGGWYYWHPTLNVWVHAHRDRDWRPPAKAHVYHSWAEHPMYRRPR